MGRILCNYRYELAERKLPAPVLKDTLFTGGILENLQNSLFTIPQKLSYNTYRGITAI